MLNLINRTGRKQKVILVGVLVALVATLALAGISNAGEKVECPPGTKYVYTGLPPYYYACVSLDVDDGACDYGRNPETLWPDNPDGHPFERAFCDGLTEVQYKHPLDSLETEGLYCDEVPGCWAYGMTQDGHH